MTILCVASSVIPETMSQVVGIPHSDLNSLALWAQIFGVIFTAIAAGVAAFAAWVSYKSAKNLQKTNDEIIRPRIVIFVQSVENVNKNFIELVIRNDGGGIAKDIQFTVEGDDLQLDYQQSGMRNLSDLKAIKNGIHALPSKSERKYYILSLIGQYDEVLAKTTTINTQYIGHEKMPYKDSFTLDFATISESRWKTNSEEMAKGVVDGLSNITNAIKSKK